MHALGVLPSIGLYGGPLSGSGELTPESTRAGGPLDELLLLVLQAWLPTIAAANRAAIPSAIGRIGPVERMGS